MSNQTATQTEAEVLEQIGTAVINGKSVYFQDADGDLQEVAFIKSPSHTGFWYVSHEDFAELYF